MVYMSVILYIEYNMEISDQSPNYTLSSEGTRDVIRRAKEAGINISGIISQLQNALADQQNEGNSFNDLANIYQKLFGAMKSFMQPYDVMRVEVGSPSSTPVFLDKEGLYKVISSKRYPIAFSVAPAYLYHPMISALIVAAEENNLSIFDLNEGTCNYYVIDSVKTDWVEQQLVQ
jgi:hypothetical protein